MIANEKRKVGLCVLKSKDYCNNLITQSKKTLFSVLSRLWCSEKKQNETQGTLFSQTDASMPALKV